MQETSFERQFELAPAAPPVTPRVVGPGKRERVYQAGIARLEGDLAARARELDTSQRLERGCQRLLDRLEHVIDGDRAKIERLEQQHKRLILALGAAQHELEDLRRRLALAPPARAELASDSAQPKRSRWRPFRRARGPRDA